MSKVIKEIAKLLWKALRLVVWKWLGPIVRRFTFLGVIVMGILALIVFIATRL